MRFPTNNRGDLGGIANAGAYEMKLNHTYIARSAPE